MRITRQLADAAVQNLDGMNELLPEVEYYIPMVRKELDEINRKRVLGSSHHVTRCLLFALASPMNRFDANVIVAKRLHDRLDSLQSVQDVYDALSEGGTGTLASGNVARYIFSSLPRIKYYRQYGATGYIGERLREEARLKYIIGAGPKVTAMAAHLWNAYDNVFTLDTHMLRMIMKNTMGLKGTWDVKEPMYYTLENAMLAWSRQHFYNDPQFAVQWALWCAQKKEFVSHVGIFS